MKSGLQTDPYRYLRRIFLIHWRESLTRRCPAAELCSCRECRRNIDFRFLFKLREGSIQEISGVVFGRCSSSDTVDALSARSWKRWLDKSAHYHSLSSGMKLENPDQRIQVAHTPDVSENALTAVQQSFRQLHKLNCNKANLICVSISSVSTLARRYLVAMSRLCLHRPY